MSKEQLEEIKHQLEESNSYDDNPNGYWYHNINWLIEQAERVQELERDFGVVQLNRALEQDSFKMLEELKGLLEDENKRYREAIKNIEKGYKRVLSEQSIRLLTEQYTRVSNLKFIHDEIKALESEE